MNGWVTVTNNAGTTFKNNEQKQISLLEAMDVDVMLNFNNSAKNNLGIRLPKGTVRVFTNDKEV